MEGLDKLFPTLEARAKQEGSMRAVRQRPGNPLVTVAMLVIGLPLYLLITIPLGAVALVHRLFFFKGKRQRDDAVSTDAVAQLTKEHNGKGYPAPDKRPYDIVVLGATGLTGGVLAQYLATHHADMRVALAGRTKAKVEAVKAALGVDGAKFGVLVADSNDLSSLFDLCRQTKVIATTVGPFKRYGTVLVHACAHSGTHYADLTGESDWVSQMAKLYDGVAKRSGAAIVSCCGVDSVPSDVGAFLAAQRLRQENGESTTVNKIEAVMTKFTGGAPAGTIETISGVLDGTDVLPKPPQYFKPTMADRVGATRIVGLNSALNRSSAFNQWTIPFFMAQTNACTVRRTNSRLGFASDLQYSERWGFPDLSSAVATFTGVYIMGGTYVALPLLRGIARSAGGLPKADAGAKAVTVERCTKGACCILVSATGKNDKGATVSTQLRFSGLGDVGVAHTAICQGEIAVLLAKRKAGPKSLVGVGLTPVAALGNSLSDALVKTGLVFIEDVPAASLRK